MNIAELFVRIRGDAAPLERSLRSASGSLDRFDSSTQKLGKSMRALRANWLAVSAVIGTVGFALNKTFQAADAFEASQRKLASTAKITGQNLGFLQTIAADANKEFGLGARMANEFAIEVSKLTGKAGEIEQTGEAIRALLNLGAGRGFGAAQTLQAVQQAILGIDEGTDKLFGKNPSVIYAEFAQQVGISAGKMNDQQKAMALLNAAMQDGGKVATAYAEFLKSPAGQTEQLRTRTEELAASIGTSMQSIRSAALPIWGAIIEEIREFIEEARSIPIHLELVARKAQAIGGAIRAAFSDPRFAAQILSGLPARLDMLEAAATESLQRIRNEMNLVTDIVGPTSPITTGINAIAAATDGAAQAAQRLADGFRSAKIEADKLASIKGALGGTKQRAGFVAGVAAGAPAAPGIIGPVATGGAAGGGGLLGNFGGAISSFVGGLGSQFASLAASLGPLALAAAALKPVFEGMMETLGPVLATLEEPLRIVGNLLGAVIAPVLKLLAPPLRLLARIVSYVVEALGTLVRAIGKAIDALPFVSAKGVIRAGESMIQSAKDARRALEETSSGVEGLGDAAAKATAQLVNYARVAHINALRFMVGAGTAGGSVTGGSVRPGGRPGLSITVNGMPAEVLVEEGGRIIQRVASRGGTTRFALAT